MAAAGQAPISVLIFHRIADDRANYWTTPTQTFVQAIRWLKPRFDLISLAEAQRRIRAGANHRAAVSITFDDGYAENCRIGPAAADRGTNPLHVFRLHAAGPERNPL